MLAFFLRYWSSHLHYVDSKVEVQQVIDLLSKAEPIEPSRRTRHLPKQTWNTGETGIAINSVQREVWSPQSDWGHPDFFNQRSFFLFDFPALRH